MLLFRFVGSLGCQCKFGCTVQGAVCERKPAVFAAGLSHSVIKGVSLNLIDFSAASLTQYPGVNTRHIKRLCSVVVRDSVKEL